MTVDGARRAMLELAAFIAEVEARLAVLAEYLPASPDRDAMYECLIPYDVPAELFAVAECVREEYLVPAAGALARAAGVEQATLEARFRDLAPITRAHEPKNRRLCLRGRSRE